MHRNWSVIEFQFGHRNRMRPVLLRYMAYDNTLWYLQTFLIKLDHHDITEILLKVALNTINHYDISIFFSRNYKFDRWLSSVFFLTNKSICKETNQAFLCLSFLYKYMKSLKNDFNNLFDNTHVQSKIYLQFYLCIIYIANEGHHVSIMQ